MVFYAVKRTDFRDHHVVTRNTVIRFSVRCFPIILRFSGRFLIPYLDKIQRFTDNHPHIFLLNLKTGEYGTGKSSYHALCWIEKIFDSIIHEII